MNNTQRRLITAITSIVVIILCTIVIISGISIKNRLTDIDNGDEIATPTNPKDPELIQIDITPQAPYIDLQETVESWVKSLGTAPKVGVMVYDLTNNHTAATYHADEVFNVASIYKLLFAYDGYRQLALGLENPNSFYVNTKDKGNLTISNCLDLIIRESYNGCADRMIRDPARVLRVNNLVEELGMFNTSENGLSSTAADITKLLLFYWRHPDLSEELWNQIADSMLRQPPSVSDDGKLYDWRQGLPAGFSQNINAYNKVGWAWNGNYWDTYADAAIVDFTELNHTYIVVVLTSSLSSANQVSRLGQMLEEAIITQSNK